MSQSWYVKHNGKTVGPITSAKLRQLVDAAKVKPATEVRLGENGQWIQASRVKGLLSEQTSPQQQRSHRQSQSTNPQPTHRDKEQGSTERSEVAKSVQSNGAPRRVTPLSIGLVVLAMFLVLVLMVSIHMRNVSIHTRNIRAEAEARAATRVEKIEPVSKTTAAIELATWDIRRWGIHHQQRVPQKLSDAVKDHTDGWGKPMRIELEGSPVSGYRITSAGEDGEFASQDDIAIRFSLDHEQIDRINTYGLREMKTELDAVKALVRDAKPDDETPQGRFTFSNGVLQVLAPRDVEYLTSSCESESDLARAVEAFENAHERLLDHIEEVDPRAKARVPGGRFTDEQWAEVEEIATGISLKEMKPVYDSILKEIGAGSDEKVVGPAGREQKDRSRLDSMLANIMRLGASHLRQGALEKAKSEYRDALKYDSDYGPAHLGLGQALQREGKLNEALEEFRIAVELDPKHAIAHNQLAWTLLTHPDKDGEHQALDEAVASAKKACELSVDNFAYLNTLGVALYRSGDWSGAIEALEDSVELGAKTPYNWLFIAMAQWQLGNKEQSRTLYDKSIAWREKNKTDEELEYFFAEAERLLVAGVDSPSEN